MGVVANHRIVLNKILVMDVSDLDSPLQTVTGLCQWEGVEIVLVGLSFIPQHAETATFRDVRGTSN